MAVENNDNFKLANANLLTAGPYSLSATSEVVGHELSKALTYRRSETWKPKGSFFISGTINDSIYINDGTNKASFITTGQYNTGADLAAGLQVILNTISSGFTVSYTNNRFTIARTTSFTLRVSVDSSSVWKTLGFTGSTDLVGTSIVANEKRCHYPYEVVSIDFGYNAEIDFFAMIGKKTEEFQISDSATITIMANNLNDFTNPPLNVTATVTNEGAFYIFNRVDSSYRYWQIRIQDFENPLGGSWEISNLYLGQYVQLESRNINAGFNYTINDVTQVSESESGVSYFDVKTKYYSFSGVTLGLLDQNNCKIFRDFFEEQGISTPFYLILDPNNKISSSIEEKTRLVYFTSSPRFTHVFFKYFSVDCDFREVL